MASYTVTAAEVGVHEKALTAATVDTVTFADDRDRVRVIFVAGTTPIYFTVDNTAPTVGGQGSHYLPAVVGAVAEVEPSTPGATVVKLISSGASTYGVEAGS